MLCDMYRPGKKELEPTLFITLLFVIILHCTVQADPRFCSLRLQIARLRRVYWHPCDKYLLALNMLLFS